MEIISFLIEFLRDPLIVLTTMISQYGPYIYFFLFMIVFIETGVVVMPFLPGDSLLFSVGLIASTTGQINVLFIIPLLILAAVLGDNLNYFIGTRFGDYVKSRERVLFLKKENIDDTEKYFEKNGAKTIVIARFIPIVRTVAPFVAGAGEMRYPIFLAYSITGAILWVTSITLLGYFLGSNEWVKANFEKVVLGIVFISVLPIITNVLKNAFSKK